MHASTLPRPLHLSPAPSDGGGRPARPAVPGISLASGGTVLPSGNTLPLDASSRSEGNVIAQGQAVTISPVQGMPEASRQFEGWLQQRLQRR